MVPTRTALDAHLQAVVADPRFPQALRPIVVAFFDEYRQALSDAGLSPASFEHLLETLVRLMAHQLERPFVFEPYHQPVVTPFDHYTFGLEFLRPLVDMERSTVRGRAHLDEIVRRLAAGENVIFLANHQTEGDPQAISLLLERDYPALGREMVFVAGDRVTTDPLAVPFSMGRHLLCIFSKRHIEHPPERRTAKQLHNKRTMERMSDLLALGGRAIYVAPSGGRDRLGPAGVAEVAAFDPQAIDMMALMAARSRRTTHFHPMALATYDLLPPPATVDAELGEARHIRRSAIHLGVGAALDLAASAGESGDRRGQREQRAEAIWRTVCAEYAALGSPVAIG